MHDAGRRRRPTLAFVCRSFESGSLPVLRHVTKYGQELRTTAWASGTISNRHSWLPAVLLNSARCSKNRGVPGSDGSGEKVDALHGLRAASYMAC